MLSNVFTDLYILLGGLICGIIIGMFLQKSKLSQFSTLVGQFLLRDFTYIKILLSAICVGSIGIYVLTFIGLPPDPVIKGGSLLMLLIGASLVGIGITILGYDPATVFAALGQGSSDALWGILGMLVGAFLYAELYFLPATLLTVWQTKKSTLPKILHIPHWMLITAIFAILLLMLIYRRKKKTTLQ